MVGSSAPARGAVSSTGGCCWCRALIPTLIVLDEPLGCSPHPSPGATDAGTRTLRSAPCRGPASSPSSASCSAVMGTFGMHLGRVGMASPFDASPAGGMLPRPRAVLGRASQLRIPPTTDVSLLVSATQVATGNEGARSSFTARGLLHGRDKGAIKGPVPQSSTFWQQDERGRWG